MAFSVPVFFNILFTSLKKSVENFPFVSNVLIISGLSKNSFINSIGAFFWLITSVRIFSN
uniref:Uncharacterized protein n=1 Tax=Siphoviridae sp. ctWhx86 TaxID=2826362 RepID=A0A8S5QPX8_9CAUD|nr:MAG TPA: hypothetical protein [Siphoviridae sp. ctWhx86]